MKENKIHFYLDGGWRKKEIAAQRFVFEQATARLFSSFQANETEADRYTALRWDEMTGGPVTGEGCLGAIAEAAQNEGLTHYLLLEMMRRNVILSVAAMMYHHWEKRLAVWHSTQASLCSEVPAGDGQKFWTANFRKRLNHLHNFGWDVRATDFYQDLDELRLVANTYKHGEGGSMTQLFERRPDLFKDLGGTMNKQYDCLDVSERQLQMYSDAIIHVWTEMPEVLVYRGCPASKP